VNKKRQQIEKFHREVGTAAVIIREDGKLFSNVPQGRTQKSILELFYEINNKMSFY
jgi:hypothetical protein